MKAMVKNHLVEVIFLPLGIIKYAEANQPSNYNTPQNQFPNYLSTPPRTQNQCIIFDELGEMASWTIYVVTVQRVAIKNHGKILATL